MYITTSDSGTPILSYRGAFRGTLSSTSDRWSPPFTRWLDSVIACYRFPTPLSFVSEWWNYVRKSLMHSTPLDSHFNAFFVVVMQYLFFLLLHKSLQEMHQRLLIDLGELQDGFDEVPLHLGRENHPNHHLEVGQQLRWAIMIRNLNNVDEKQIVLAYTLPNLIYIRCSNDMRWFYSEGPRDASTLRLVYPSRWVLEPWLYQVGRIMDPLHLTTNWKSHLNIEPPMVPLWRSINVSIYSPWNPFLRISFIQTTIAFSRVF